MKPNFYPLLLAAFFVFSSCAASTKTKSLKDDYQNAIEDAMCPDSGEICTSLVAIDSNNASLVWKEINGEKYLLAVSWKQTVSYYKNDPASGFYNTGNYEIWVTIAPQLLNWDQNEKTTDLDTRLKQLLGLPPTSEYSYFVEFWVKPGDLFRPCPDKEINDGNCGLCFPENADSAHIEWINANRISRYYPCGLYNKYPWTQLGYTYDWNPGNPSHVGMSEFVIGKGKNIVVNRVCTTEDYFSGK